MVIVTSKEVIFYYQATNADDAVTNTLQHVELKKTT